jgi:hypothetical protein
MISLMKWVPCCPAVITFAVAVVLCSSESAMGAPFQNLDFESAVIGKPTGDVLPASQAMPGWTSNGFFAVGGVPDLFYDTISTGGTIVSLEDGLDPYFHFHPIQGSYSALLQSGDPRYEPVAWISQTGDVPSNANSLMFSTDSAWASSLAASLNGTVIPMSLYSVGPVIDSNLGPVETFIGDTRQFTGQGNVELRFTGSGGLDAIQFSSLIVPEPSMLVLLSIGILSLAAYFRPSCSHVARLTALRG